MSESPNFTARHNAASTWKNMRLKKLLMERRDKFILAAVLSITFDGHSELDPLTFFWLSMESLFGVR